METISEEFPTDHHGDPGGEDEPVEAEPVEAETGAVTSWSELVARCGGAPASAGGGLV